MAEQLILQFEEWRKIEGYPGYEVSSVGRVRSLDRTIICKSGIWKGLARRYSGKLLNPTVKKPGYFCVALSNEKMCAATVRVHVIVAIAFHGAQPTPEHEVAHGDGNKLNNHFGNLRWATHAENNQDKLLHGTDNRGEKHPLSVLTEDQVRAIRNATGSQYRISEHFGVSQGTVSDIKLGRRWGWLA